MASTALASGSLSVLRILGLCALLLFAASATFVEAQTLPNTRMYEGPACFSIVVEEVSPTGAVVASGRQPEQQAMSAGDDLYIDTAGQQMRAGDRFQIHRVDAVVKHPLTGSRVGHALNMIGTVRLLEVVGEQALAAIESACLEIEIGDPLRAMPTGQVAVTLELPTFEPDRIVVPSPDDARVVYGSGESLLRVGARTGRVDSSRRDGYGAGDVVIIDQGSTDGWRLSDRVLFYRDRRDSHDPRSIDQAQPILLGQGAVFWIQGQTAAVLVTAGDRRIALGAGVRRDVQSVQ